MDGSGYFGLVAVMAASGSVVLVALQAHRRLTSDFQKKFEMEIGGVNRGVGFCGSTSTTPSPRKKKVRFADDVVEPSSDNKEYRRRHSCRMRALSSPAGVC